MIVPPDVSTPVHDHLAWGLVGLYRGEQEETIFTRRNEEAPVRDHEELSFASKRIVGRGGFYPLLPPAADIHFVHTTSKVHSVSIHLLANDTGCVWQRLLPGDGGGAVLPLGIREPGLRARLRKYGLTVNRFREEERRCEYA